MSGHAGSRHRPAHGTLARCWARSTRWSTRSASGAIDLGAVPDQLPRRRRATSSAFVLAIAGVAGLISARRREDAVPEDELAPAAGLGTKGKEPVETRTGLADLAALAFLASLAFMALEMVAGRLVTRHLGSSIYGWSSVIAVLLAGLSLGNFLGGKIADFIRNEKQASWLFLAGLDPDPVHPAARDAAAVAPRRVLRLGRPEVAALVRTAMTRPSQAPAAQDVPLTWPYRGSWSS